VAREPFRYDDRTHTYRLGPHVVPAISAVLRHQEVGRSGPWFKDEHRQRGKAVHRACLALDMGERPERLPDEWMAYVEGWRAFTAAVRPRWREMEQPRVHRGLWFAGTPDRVGLVGGPAVVEIKTGSEAEWHGVQLAAQDLLTRRPGHPRRRRLSVVLRRDGTYRLHEHDDPRDELRFLQALRRYQLEYPPPRAA